MRKLTTLCFAAVTALSVAQSYGRAERRELNRDSRAISIRMIDGAPSRTRAEGIYLWRRGDWIYVVDRNSRDARWDFRGKLHADGARIVDIEPLDRRHDRGVWIDSNSEAHWKIDSQANQVGFRFRWQPEQRTRQNAFVSITFRNGDRSREGLYLGGDQREYGGRSTGITIDLVQ